MRLADLVRVTFFVTIDILITFRCMEHTIYLAAKAFINKVKPQTPKNKRSTKNGTATVKDANEDNDNMDEDDDDWVLD
jgi:hypothetical protein